MESKGERTKKEICRVARSLFSQKGYKDVSMQDICNATGLSRGGLYRHFANKSEILFELLKKEKQVQQDIDAGMSAVETLENLLQIYREDMEGCRESLALALFEYATSENDNVLDSGNTADKEHWHKLVKYGVSTGEFLDIDPDVVMDSFMYSYRGIMMWGRVLPFATDTFEHLTEAVRYLLIKDYTGRKH